MLALVPWAAWEQAETIQFDVALIDIREYIDCSLAGSAYLVLVEWLCHQPLLNCGATIRHKRTILLYFLLRKFKLKL